MANIWKPSNKQTRNLLQKMVNRLVGSPLRTCRSLHSCVFCGSDITLGQQYRDRGYAARAHDICFNAVAEDLKRSAHV